MLPSFPRTLRQRAEDIRLSSKELAALAGVDEDTVYNVFNARTDPRLSTIEKIEAALTAEEARLREQLGKSGEAA